MKNRKTIPILFSMLLLSAAMVTMAQPQEPLPAEKKKALHKIDPADIFTEEREDAREKGKKKPAQNAQPPTVANNPATPAATDDGASQRRAGRLGSSGSSLSLATGDPIAPTPTPSMAVVRAANPVPTPTPVATPPLQSRQSPASTSEPASTPVAVEVSQSSPPQSGDLTASVSTGNQSISSTSGRTTSFPLAVTFTLLGVILLALIVVVVSLKKQLRAP
ncbi:MAG: hypothetical protein L0226_13560 [Acidobacteria bacterium]|nr:hypothetical protein [Acidobacteriota bacterium]